MGFYLTVEAEDEYGDTIEATVDSEDMLNEIGDFEIVKYLEEHGYILRTPLENDKIKTNIKPTL